MSWRVYLSYKKTHCSQRVISCRRLSQPFFVCFRGFPTDWYNFLMPTPFYHLSLAEELVSHPNLQGNISQFLQAFRGGFLFGNTAPDVQVVSGQLRQETHFFNLPIQTGDRPAWELLLSDHPHL